MSEFYSDTKPIVGLRRNHSNASLSIHSSSTDYARREIDSSSSVAAVVPHDDTITSPVQLSAEYVASARQHKPLRDRLLQLDQQNELNTIKLTALREEKEKRSDQFRRELAGNYFNSCMFIYACLVWFNLSMYSEAYYPRLIIQIKMKFIHFCKHMHVCMYLKVYLYCQFVLHIVMFLMICICMHVCMYHVSYICMFF